MSDSPRKRGRPATIDTQTAMQSVVELFRAKGYAAVSLDDLSEATGLSRPSLYRSFGNKLSMYLNAMDAFVDQVGQSALPALREPRDLCEALTSFYAEMLTIYYRDGEMAPGCLVYATAPCSADDEIIQTRLKQSIASTDGLMRARILSDAPKVDPATLETAVQIATNTLIAFSARAKSGASKAELLEMGHQSAKVISHLVGVGD